MALDINVQQITDHLTGGQRLLIRSGEHGLLSLLPLDAEALFQALKQWRRPLVKTNRLLGKVCPECGVVIDDRATACTRHKVTRWDK